VKYIICGTEAGPFGTDTRPTQASFKDYGPGEYQIRRGDGSISKIVTVTTNRNGNLKMEASSPEGLDALSTIVLGRLVRAYAPIVKYWPKSRSAKEYKQVVDEMSARTALLATVGAKFVPGPAKPAKAQRVQSGCAILDDGTTGAATFNEDGTVTVERAALVGAAS